MTDLPFTLPDPDPTRPERQPAKCRRHQWVPTPNQPEGGAFGEERCRRCNKRKADAATVSRIRRASARGFRTSADLAAYLGGQNVDKLGWPWDVQGRGYRIQSKRLVDRPSGAAMVRLLEAIPYRTDDLRAVFYVPPRARLTSGLVVLGLREWVDTRGWEVPPGARPFHTSGHLLLEMPLPTFRDLHVGVTA